MKKREIIILIVVAIFLGLVAISMTYSPSLKPVDVPLSEAIQTINSGETEKVIQDGDDIYIFIENGIPRHTLLEHGKTPAEVGIDTQRTKIERQAYSSPNSSFATILASLVPVVIIGFLLSFSVYTLYSLWHSNEKNKALWTLLILLVFPIGAVIYYFSQRDKELDQ